MKYTHTCQRCTNSWSSNKQAEQIKSCGVCKTKSWRTPEKDKKQFKCFNCGYMWRSSQENPSRCAKCNTTGWRGYVTFRDGNIVTAVSKRLQKLQSALSE